MKRFTAKQAVIIALLLTITFTGGALMRTTLAYILDRAQPLVNTFAPSTTIIEGEINLDIITTLNIIGGDGSNLSPEGYSFTMTDQLTGDQRTMVTGKDGMTTFPFTFNSSHAGQEFVYHVEMVNEGQPGVLYSDLVYEVRIVIENRNDNLVVQVYINGAPTTNYICPFEIIYPYKEPITGDSSTVLINVALMLASLTALIIINRRGKRMAH